jgi:tetratricopeptide (TPR) repeat protein
MRRTFRPYDTERLLRAVSRIQGDRVFQNEEEAAAFYARFKGRSVDEIQAQAGSDRQEDAQELAFRALEADEKSQAAALACEALTLDRDCTDAQVVLAQVEALSSRDLTKRLTIVVDKAEAKLGEGLLREHKGRLWGVLEARPYLRVRLALAENLEKIGRFSEAIQHYKELFESNRPDIQGIRFPLTRCYLAVGDLKAVAELLKRFEDEDATFVAWDAVLERVKSKDETGAQQALSHARNVNPYFEELLESQEQSPEPRPAVPEPGSREEASAVFRILGEAWKNDREALNWLARQG